MACKPNLAFVNPSLLTACYQWAKNDGGGVQDVAVSQDFVSQDLLSQDFLAQSIEIVQTKREKIRPHQLAG
jgi:hypothetical protein